MWATELPPAASHIRLSWLPETALNEHERYGKVEDGTIHANLELGPLWDEFRSLDHGPLLQPFVTSLLTTDELHRIICQFHTHILEYERDGAEWKDLNQTRRPMSVLADFLADKYGGAADAANVQLFYVLKSLSKRQAKPRFGLFIDVLTAKADYSLWLHVETCAKVVMTSMPTEVISWTEKLEEAMLKRLFDSVADKTKLGLLRVEFGHYLVANQTVKEEGDESSSFQLRDMMADFVSELVRKRQDPFLEFWHQRLEMLLYKSPKGTVITGEMLAEEVRSYK